jgi:hypothetical protein
MAVKFRKGFSRRAFLGGAGAVVALPFFESLLPAKWGRTATPQGPGPNKRLLFYYVPNGMHMPSWTPAEVGNEYTLPLILEPLQPYQSELLVLSGISNMPAHPDGPGDHAAGTGSFLTGTHCFKTEGDDIKNGISVDQVAANAVGADYPFGSVQLGLEGGSSVGGCDSGYSCAYSRNISWSGPKTPVPKVVNPQLVFDRFFGGMDPAATQEELARRKKYRKSVLDYVIGDAESVQSTLGASDRHKLEEYLTGVRELELKIDAADSAPACEAPGYPAPDLDFATKAKVMTDLMVVAFQCNLTPIITFMLANAASGRSYSFLDVSGGHHDISHHQDNPDNFAKLEIIDRWEVEQFAYLLKRLSEVEEGEGTLLDNTLCFFSSEVADGNKHHHRNLPILLAGRGGGSVTPGRHVSYEGEPPISNLFISLLDTMGVHVDAFGDEGTGPISDLKL